MIWKPVGKAEANFELMISEANWGDKGIRTGTRWQGRRRLESTLLQYKYPNIYKEGESLVNKFSLGNWHWTINRTENGNITRPHYDYNINQNLRRWGKNLRDTVEKISNSENEKNDLLKQWIRFWIPMRDRVVGEYFESSFGVLTDWKAGDIFHVDAGENHCGATVGFTDRYTFIAEGLKSNLNEEFQKLV